MPAAAVIPAPIAYIKVAAVKKLVVVCRVAVVKRRRRGLAGLLKVCTASVGQTQPMPFGVLGVGGRLACLIACLLTADSRCAAD